MLAKGPPTSHNSFKIIAWKTLLKTFFDINLHHGLIKVQVKKGSNIKRDGFIALKGKYPKLMGG
jgi:hypothetical protein